MALHLSCAMSNKHKKPTCNIYDFSDTLQNLVNPTQKNELIVELLSTDGRRVLQTSHIIPTHLPKSPVIGDDPAKKGVFIDDFLNFTDKDKTLGKLDGVKQQAAQVCNKLLFS